MTYESILDAAVNLPEEDRVRLAKEIVASVTGEHGRELSPEWRAEIERRWAEFEAGRMEAEDWEIVHQRLFGPGNSDNAG